MTVFGVQKLHGSSCSEVFCKKGVLRNFAKFIGKRLCQSLFFNKVACKDSIGNLLMDKLQPDRVFWFEKWSILIVNIDKSPYKIHYEELFNSSSVILMNVYVFFRISTWSSVCQYVLLQCIMNTAFSLYMIQLTGKEPNSFCQKETLIELNFVSVTWLHWFSLINKVTHKQISTCSKSFQIENEILETLNFT